MAKRILVPMERANDMDFALRMAGMIARESGGVVRLLAVIPIPKPVYDSRGCLVVSTDQLMERLADAAADRLKRISVLDLEGVPVEIFAEFQMADGRPKGMTIEQGGVKLTLLPKQ